MSVPMSVPSLSWQMGKKILLKRPFHALTLRKSPVFQPPGPAKLELPLKYEIACRQQLIVAHQTRYFPTV
jgi:hypothetical protein